MSNEERAVPRRARAAEATELQKRLVVRQAFAYAGTYYTTENINEAPPEALEKYKQSGHVIEELGPA